MRFDHQQPQTFKKKTKRCTILDIVEYIFKESEKTIEPIPQKFAVNVEIVFALFRYLYMIFFLFFFFGAPLLLSATLTRLKS